MFLDFIPLSVYNITGVDIMNYKSIKEIALTWGLSERRVRVLCSEGRIEGVVKVGRSWNIPEDATKPLDYRIKVLLPFEGIMNNELLKSNRVTE